MINQSNYDETRDSTLDQIRDQGLKENNALRVYTYLKANERARSRRLPRWIWELLQNAHDASIAHEEPLIVNIKYSPGELVFSHNGSSFEAKQIFNLIYHGSTKADEEEAIGEYGSGFLTTHLLSPEIKVLGQLDDKQDNRQWFGFCLTRKSDSPDELLDLMDETWKNFKKSLLTQDLSIPDPFTTQFVYPIIGADAEKAVEEGIKTLKQCASFVVVFNSKFSRIDINDRGETLCFEAIERDLTDTPEIQQVTVAAHKNGNTKKNKYLLALSSDKKTSVAAPLELNSSGSVCQFVENMPRLFKAFPLVGTELFSFPAVVNSFKFTVTETRDDVYLGQDEKDEANIGNQTVIEEACMLLVRLIKHAVSERWHQTHQWAKVPTIQHQDEHTRKWIKECIENKLIAEIAKTPAIITETGKTIEPNDARLPLIENDKDKNVEELWDLLNDWQKYSEKLPRRDEAAGWCKVIKSWANVSGEEVSELNMAIDAHGLALDIENFSYIHDLQNLFQENVCAVKWLDRLYDFLKKHELFDDKIRSLYFIPNQTGELHQLDSLYRDQGIADALKHIDKLLEGSIRDQLRDTQLTSLENEVGAGDLGNEDVVKDLIDELQENADNNPNNEFKEASRLLFAWIVNQKDYSRLRGFPVFAEDSDEPRIIQLPHPTQDNTLDNERPLGPIKSWSNDLQDYAELFPRRHIVANIFFEDIPDPDTWQTLEEEGLIRKDVIIRDCQEISFEALQSCEPLMEKVDHESEKKVAVTDIAFLTKKDIGVIDRVRKSRPLAYKFWRFLTEWLIIHDPEGVKTITKACICKETHRCYPAQWLKPVVDRKWIPLGEGISDVVKSETLATLLRGSSWNPNSLSETHLVAKLLEAIGVSRFDLIRQAAAENDDTRVAVDNAFIEMLAKTGGNVSNLNHAVEYIEALKDDEDLPNIVAKHQDRKRTIKENKNFGDQVEEIVGLILKNQGYSVKGIHKGADFKISELTEDSEDTDTLITLTVTDKTCGREWLIEVKSARTESVKMSFAQADTAVEYGENFLLCVVPMKPENTELNLEEKKEIVRENIQFIKNIGTHIDQLLADRNALEDLRTYATVDNGSGVRLVYETGTTGIRVDHSVWENEGFPLKDLAENLE